MVIIQTSNFSLIWVFISRLWHSITVYTSHGAISKPPSNTKEKKRLFRSMNSIEPGKLNWKNEIQMISLKLIWKITQLILVQLSVKRSLWLVTIISNNYLLLRRFFIFCKLVSIRYFQEIGINIFLGSSTISHPNRDLKKVTQARESSIPGVDIPRRS